MFGNHGLCGLPEEGTHEKSPKCLDGNLGDFGEFCKGLNLLDCPNVCQVRIVFLNKINQKLSVRLDIAGRLKRSDDLLLKLRWKYQKFPELNVCNCM